jgi:hypothetical protein
MLIDRSSRRTIVSGVGGGVTLVIAAGRPSIESAKSSLVSTPPVPTIEPSTAT